MGVEWLGTQRSNEFYFLQTGLTGSTAYFLSFDPVHLVILSRIKEPQMNADKRRLIASAHRKGREERKAAHQKSLRPLRSLRLINLNRIKPLEAG